MTFSDLFVPGQKRGRTEKVFLSGTKGQRDFLYRIFPGYPIPWKPYLVYYVYSLIVYWLINPHVFYEIIENPHGTCSSYRLRIAP